jgi:hypothetical protein
VTIKAATPRGVSPLRISIRDPAGGLHRDPQLDPIIGSVDQVLFRAQIPLGRLHGRVAQQHCRFSPPDFWREQLPSKLAGCGSVPGPKSRFGGEGAGPWRRLLPSDGASGSWPPKTRPITFNFRAPGTPAGLGRTLPTRPFGGSCRVYGNPEVYLIESDARALRSRQRTLNFAPLAARGGLALTA